MRRRGAGALRALAVIGLAACIARPGTGLAAPEGGLQPYQMVRSLQLVQDRIAGGDHAALPMQRKLLELIDERIRNSGDAEFGDRRNFHALMIYAMSGGNPATIADMLARLEMDDADRAVGAGVLGYLLGDVAQSRTALAHITPRDHPQELAAFLSLVKGSVMAGDDLRTGMAMLDDARLLSPGTLVEEAALRRTIALAAGAGDGRRFISAAERYARRYLRSPYASQFAESFVSGIVDLRPQIDLDLIGETVAWMTTEQARTVYLRLARRAAIDGDADLLGFASRKAANYADAGGAETADPRSELYSGISSVTSETVEEVLQRLQGLDPARLSARDRALLAAAKAVAEEVVAPVRAASQSSWRARQAEAEPEQPSIDAVSGAERLAAARSKLEAVDRLLEESGR